jgi:aryl-alcohol dehydrogenase (NADP+)
MYSEGVSEEILGRALRDFGPSRDKVVIATKIFSPMGPDANQRGLSRKHILHAIDDSLHPAWDVLCRSVSDPPVRLPDSNRRDLGGARRTGQDGEALYIGASSMFAWQFAKMLYTSDQRGLSRFVTMQNHYNLIYREEERQMNPLCWEEGVGLLPWSPLARRSLTRSGTNEYHGNHYPGALRDLTNGPRRVGRHGYGLLH